MPFHPQAIWLLLLRHYHNKHSLLLTDLFIVGKVLIFVTKKIHAEDVANRLRTKDFKPILLHGDMLQAERNEKLQAFRKDANILVATDVAGKENSFYWVVPFLWL